MVGANCRRLFFLLYSRRGNFQSGWAALRLLRHAHKQQLLRKVSFIPYLLYLISFSSYGFVLADNPLNNFRFRVIIGTTPQEAIKSPNELIPTPALLEDRTNIDITTEVITIRQDRLSTGMFNYLRSVLLPNYKETGLPDQSQIMISCPRLIAYELIVTNFAISLLEHVHKT